MPASLHKHTCLSKKAGCKHGTLGKSCVAHGSACFIYGMEEAKCFVGLRHLFDIAFGYGDCIAYMQYTSALLQKI